MFSERTIYSWLPEREISIFVAIPNMGEVVLGLALRCLRWATDRRFKTTFYTPQGVRPIPKVRNLIAKEFLKSGFAHLMMVDADIVPPENVLDLALMGLDVVGALCPARQGGRTLYIALKSVPNSLYLEVISPLPPSQLVEVDATGCGCLFVRREVFERIERPYFEYLRVDEEGLEFAGEDFNFCRKVRGAGF